MDESQTSAAARLRCRCDNCDYECDVDQLNPIEDIFQRVEAGERMPAGECPKCGCLAHLIEPPHRIVVTVEGGLVQSIDNIPEGIEVHVWDFDVEGTDEQELQINRKGERYTQSVWQHGPCECEKPGTHYSGVRGIVGTDPKTAERCDLCQRYETDEQARAVLRRRTSAVSSS